MADGVVKEFVSQDIKPGLPPGGFEA